MSLIPTLNVKKMRKPHNIFDKKPDSIWSFYLKYLLHNVILNYIIKVNKTNLHSVNYKFTETPKEKKQKMLSLGQFLHFIFNIMYQVDFRISFIKKWFCCLSPVAKFCKNYGIIWRSYNLHLLSNILLDIF